MQKTALPDDLYAHPSVFAVEDEYQIIIPAKNEIMVRVDIGNESFCDHSNGIMRSSSPIHKISVPMKLLDEAKKYTVCYRRVIERKAYFTETQDIKELSYPFCPIEKNQSIKVYHVADSHSRVDFAVDAALKSTIGMPDLLILNGDVAEDSASIENIIGMYKISSGITNGEVPCVFSRGNHDLRGVCAERLAEFTPNSNGKSYYTFRLNDLWGLVLDCGEDKNDDNDEYGNTVCCHDFRTDETRFIEKIAKEGKYNEDGIKYRMVVCHIPFSYADKNEKFNIEGELYEKWCRILKDTVKPDLMLCGHMHRCIVINPGDPLDNRGQPCPVVVGTRPSNFEDENGFTGTTLSFENNRISVAFTDNNGKSSTACPDIVCRQS